MPTDDPPRMAIGPPRIAVGPKAAAFVVDAVRAGGGMVVDMGDAPDALVWMSATRMQELAAELSAQPGIRWVQLPFAGVEEAIAAGLIDDRRLWSCAKGSYARPVAEHALMLALAGLRLMPERIRAQSWGRAAGTSLHGAQVTILGGGGITTELLRLLDPFGVSSTIVRRTADPLPGATQTVTTDRLMDALEGALVVFLALALTPETEGIIDRPQLEAMGDRAWLVNVARGKHVHTQALVDALAAGTIAGAALDVTDPEPLPDGHPLWSAPNCIITPHTADTAEMVAPLLASRIQVNVARFMAGEPLEGPVDPQAGY